MVIIISVNENTITVVLFLKNTVSNIIPFPRKVLLLRTVSLLTNPGEKKSRQERRNYCKVGFFYIVAALFFRNTKSALLLAAYSSSTSVIHITVIELLVSILIVYTLGGQKEERGRDRDRDGA